MKATWINTPVFDELLFFQIKNLMRPLMKTSLTENNSAVLEAAPSDRTPFADLMRHPEKLVAALTQARWENDAFDASRVFGGSSTVPVVTNGPAKTNGARKVSSQPSELRKTEFFLEARFAKSVKLAADFTDWEKFPLDMIKSDDDVWFIFVPLAPGSYAYRFIVDGVWCNDPHAARHEPNSFGTINAVVRVT